jgi:hypothetical protein
LKVESEGLGLALKDLSKVGGCVNFLGVAVRVYDD